MIDLNFWSKINFDGPIVKPELGPCWLYTGCADKRTGYGLYGAPVLREGRKFKTRTAHRYAYEQFFGKTTEQDLDHLCVTLKCVNPWHLDDVSHKENVLRGTGPTAINSKKTHCPKGHEYTRYNKSAGRWCKTCNKDSKLKRKRVAIFQNTRLSPQSFGTPSA